MDESNYSNVRRLKPTGSSATVLLFGEFRHDSKFQKIVDDPYYGGHDGFQVNFDQITDFSRGFLNKVRDGTLDKVKSSI